MTVLNLKGMGSCLSFCCKEASKRTRHVKQTRYFDSSSLIEFETLIDEQPSNEPKSLDSDAPAVTQSNDTCGLGSELYRLNFGELSSSDDSILSSSGFCDDDDILRKLAFQEETLELEEEAKQCEDIGNLPPLAQGQKVVVRAKLAKDANWTGAMQDKWVLNGEEEILNVARLKDSAHLSNCPLVHGKVWDKERDRLNSSPHSSIDLEWENEVGLTPPNQFPASATDDDFVCVPGADTCSNHSTPLSNENDLEWDGDLSSVQMSGFDMETEQLISEIEQMTAEALREPVGVVR
ncbi:unnamed protein product [Ixodes persulcatus]